LPHSSVMSHSEESGGLGQIGTRLHTILYFFAQQLAIL